MKKKVRGSVGEEWICDWKCTSCSVSVVVFPQKSTSFVEEWQHRSLATTCHIGLKMCPRSGKWIKSRWNMPADVVPELANEDRAYNPFEITSDLPSEVNHDPGYHWLGRILVLNLQKQVLYIGPHWYCSILMFVFIVGIGFFHVSTVAGQGLLQVSGGLTVTLLSLYTFMRCVVTDPGILQKNPEGEDQVLPSVRARTCQICQLIQPRGCHHCHFCQVCIEGYDHHCPWMGKCIGKKNLCAFYSFLVVSFSSLGYIMVSALAQSP